MTAQVMWLVLAGTLLASEMLTGTFYLLMLGLGALAGALCAWLGTGMALQIGVASLVGLAACFLVWQARSRDAAQSGGSAALDPLAQMDVGQFVRVESWNPDGTALVRYRGADWQACRSSTDPAPAQPGTYRIVGLEGSRLVVEKSS